MHLSTLVLAFLATTASALPATAVTNLDEGDFIGIVFYKRDNVLAPRDLALAAEHGVDPIQMYRHSLLQRSDGNDITIWVNNDFQEETEPIDTADTNISLLEKRQSVNLGGGAPYRGSGGADQRLCNPAIYPTSVVRPESAFTGGAHAMVSWGERTAGYFQIRPRCCPGFADLVIAGSNSGANARFSVRERSDFLAQTKYVGTGDIAQLVKQAITQFQRNWGNGWRVAAEGFAGCRTSIEPGQSDRATVDWELKRTNGWIN